MLRRLVVVLVMPTQLWLQLRRRRLEWWTKPGVDTEMVEMARQYNECMVYADLCGLGFGMCWELSFADAWGWKWSQEGPGMVA